MRIDLHHRTRLQKDMSMDKVIVVGCFVPGLAVVRALANKNLHVIALTYSENDIAQHSRYVSEVVRVPHPETEPERFLDCLLANGERWKGALVLESADHTAVVLSRHKEALSKYYRIVTPDWEVFEKFIQKENTYALAAQCGVPYPKSQVLGSLEQLDGSPEILYPCILKPARSYEFLSRFHVKNFMVQNGTQLREKYQLCQEAGVPMILQEIVPGPDENLFKLQGYINSRGDMAGKFFHRKLRQNPPRFGVMRVGISTERYPEVEESTQRLLCQVNYRGYFSIEFKRDPRDGQLKLMENNCRLVRCGLLATASGINYPWMIYLDLVKNQQIDITDYKVGTYWIELYADLSNSIFHQDEEQISLRDYVRPYLARDKAFAELDFHDLGPFMQLSSQRFRGAWSRITGR